MPKRSSKRGERPPRDPNEAAARLVRLAAGEEDEPAAEPEPTPPGKNPAAVALGRLGGKKGGKARAKALSKEERSAIARLAAQRRWQKEQ
jgi:hypothetical protein